MGAFRNQGNRGGVLDLSGPGDVVMIPTPVIASVVLTGTNDVIPAATLLSGIVNIDNGGTTVALPSAGDVYNALTGSGSDPNIVPATGFQVVFSASGALSITNSVDSSFISGGLSLGTVAPVALTVASFNVVQKPINLPGSITNGSSIVTFPLNNPGQSGYPIGPAPNAVNITPGAAIGTVNIGTVAAIDVGTSVAGVISGPGGVTGLEMNNEAGATGIVNIEILPKMELFPILCGMKQP
jgi:hypothetical protein